MLCVFLVLSCDNFYAIQRAPPLLRSNYYKLAGLLRAPRGHRAGKKKVLCNRSSGRETIEAKFDKASRRTAFDLSR